MRTITLTTLLFTALICTAPARAIVIFDAGLPSSGSGIAWLSDNDGSIAGPAVQQIGGLFQLNPGLSVVTDVHWWGVYGGSTLGQPIGADNFTLRFFEVSGPVVAVDPFHEISIGNTADRADTGLDVLLGGTLGPYDIFSYGVDISPVALLANTPYVISIVNDTSPFPYSWSWSSTAAATVFNQFYARAADGVIPDGLPWGAGVGDQAFFLTGIPTPATLALFGVGAMGLAWSRRKRGYA